MTTDVKVKVVTGLVFTVVSLVALVVCIALPNGALSATDRQDGHEILTVSILGRLTMSDSSKGLKDLVDLSGLRSFTHGNIACSAISIVLMIALFVMYGLMLSGKQTNFGWAIGLSHAVIFICACGIFVCTYILIVDAAAVVLISQVTQSMDEQQSMQLQQLLKLDFDMGISLYISIILVILEIINMGITCCICCCCGGGQEVIVMQHTYAVTGTNYHSPYEPVPYGEEVVDLECASSNGRV